MDDSVEVKHQTTISRQQFLKIIKRLGFVIDVQGDGVSVFRNSRFPFQRITVPADSTFSIELIKLYSKDIQISLLKLL